MPFAVDKILLQRDVNDINFRIQVLFNLFVAILIMGVTEEKSKAFKGQEEEVRQKL